MAVPKRKSSNSRSGKRRAHHFKVARQLNIPYGFISYEIFFAAETPPAFKQPEIDACAGISFAVCQGGERSRQLAVENQIAAKIIDIPVAGRGVQPDSEADRGDRSWGGVTDQAAHGLCSCGRSGGERRGRLC